MTTRATIYSIAKACGVSASTVSRAFSRPNAVRDEVRDRILAEARRQQYQPHLTARRLVTGRNQMLGVVLPDITNPFFPPLVRALQQAAAERGYGVLLGDSGETAVSERRLVDQLRPQVDGLVIASPRASAGQLRAATADTPAVFINRVLRGRRSVVVDDRAGLTDAVGHLADLGHRRVALLSGPRASWSAQQRERLCVELAERIGIDLRRLGPHEATHESGLASVPAVVRSGATAVLAFDDAMACGVLAGAHDAGLQVPDDLSIVGCDDVLLATAITPALTTLTAPVRHLGTRAVDLLDSWGSDVSCTVERVPSRLTVRQSTGPAAAGRRVRGAPPDR